MGDFGQVGAASLWKSGPLFSTGTGEAKPMGVELRLNPRSPFSDAGMASRAARWEKDGMELGPGLSTAFAESAGMPSPSREASVNRPGFMSEGRPDRTVGGGK